jgi:hypothetical protein
MHVTVQNLDALAPAAAPPRRPGGPAPLPDGLVELVAARAPFRLAVRGLGVAPGAVFVLALAGDTTLRSLRAGLAGLADGHDRGRLGQANLVRFAGPVTAGFLAELARLRRQDFGTFTVDEVELVRTDRLLSPEGTTILGRLRLEGRAG